MSFLRHNKILLIEKSKKEPNPALVNDLMDKTFFFRQKDILENPSEIDVLLQKYPFLGTEDQVS